ncbi:hypothetical protein [Streptomyces sp. NPDC001933]|uniref:hypothetical protein n=1 Tax=Streptomyces sp. NPDC001933 TaxID=3364626 RepID=UPI003689051D
MTGISRSSRVKVTRIHCSVFHICICQPDPGVAETSSASARSMPKTTLPPSTV